MSPQLLTNKQVASFLTLTATCQCTTNRQLVLKMNFPSAAKTDNILCRRHKCWPLSVLNLWIFAVTAILPATPEAKVEYDTFPIKGMGGKILPKFQIQHFGLKEENFTRQHNVTSMSHVKVQDGKQMYMEQEAYMEPKVDIYKGILPPDVCRELIELGEQSGFTVYEESIDDDNHYDGEKRYPSQAIEVYSYENKRSFVVHRRIWEVLQPHIKTLTELVKESRKKEEIKLLYPNEPDRDPQLDWVFFRKYSPMSERNSPKPHVDTNVFTLNIALNDDFEGGGLFYIKPRMQKIRHQDTRPDIDDYVRANSISDHYFHALSFFLSCLNLNCCADVYIQVVKLTKTTKHISSGIPRHGSGRRPHPQLHCPSWCC